MKFSGHIIAHRGASAYYPENTLLAFRKAQELGASWVEFDVMLTKDNVAIIIHDDTLDRTTDRGGNVADTNFTAIAECDAGSWFGEEFKNTPIPTFTATLELLKELKMGINVEIKPSIGREAETAEITVKILQKHWPSDLPLLVSSSDPECIFTAKKFAPDYYYGIIVDKWPDNWGETLERLNVFSVHANHDILTAEKVAELIKAQHLVLAYTVNDQSRANQLLDWGVGVVFTDKPDLFSK